MLVIEINAIDVKSLQAALTSSPHICWIPKDLPFPFGEFDSKLGSQFNLLSHPSLQSLQQANTYAHSIISYHIIATIKRKAVTRALP